MGAPGDAAIEFFMKVSGVSDHASLIWSNGDDATAANRFNIFWNASFTGVPGSESWLEGDWADAAGEMPNVGAPDDHSFHEIPVDAWHHVAITRHDATGVPNLCPGYGKRGHCFEWNWWVDGAVVDAQTSIVTENVLPTSRRWLVCGPLASGTDRRGTAERSGTRVGSTARSGRRARFSHQLGMCRLWRVPACRLRW